MTIKPKRSFIIVIIGLTAFTAVSAVILKPRPCSAEKQMEQETRYETYGRRDPFVPLAGIAGAKRSKYFLAEVVSADDISLSGIMGGTDGERTAILNGEIVTENMTVGIVKIIEIKNSEVTVGIDSERYVLRLYE